MYVTHSYYQPTTLTTIYNPGRKTVFFLERKLLFPKCDFEAMLKEAFFTIGPI
jgi:hypothetical protein